MKKLLLIPLAALAGAALWMSSASAQDGPPPPPTSGAVIASAYSATGGAVGPDGALYVATGGTGGDTALTPPPEFEAVDPTFGLTAEIVRIDDDGTATTVATNLPSVADSGEPLGVIADVEFIGTTMYFLLTGSANEFGAPDWPNGVYRVNGGGDGATLIADISAYNDSHPVAFEDAGPGGNPFALERRGTGFVVSDGNYNRLLSVQSNGIVTALATFENVVPTGLASGPNSTILNTWFSPAPHLPGTSFVVSVPGTGGDATQLASGPANMIDVSIGPDGNVYVLQFSDYTADEMAPPTPSGRIYQLEGSELTLLVDGMILPTSLNFSGNTAFVTSLTGAVYRIPNFSDIDPLPAPAPAPTQPAGPAPTTPAGPAPTSTPSGGSIAAPDTGDGSATGDSMGSAWLIVAVVAAAGGVLTLGGARLGRNRR